MVDYYLANNPKPSSRVAYKNIIQTLQRFIQWCYTETRNKTRLIFSTRYSRCLWFSNYFFKQTSPKVADFCSSIKPRRNPRATRITNQINSINLQLLFLLRSKYFNVLRIHSAQINILQKNMFLALIFEQILPGITQKE